MRQHLVSLYLGNKQKANLLGFCHTEFSLTLKIKVKIKNYRWQRYAKVQFKPSRPKQEKAETHRVSRFERQVARTKYWNHWNERKKPRIEHYFQKLSQSSIILELQTFINYDNLTSDLYKLFRLKKLTTIMNRWQNHTKKRKNKKRYNLQGAAAAHIPLNSTLKIQQQTTYRIKIIT